MARRVASSAAWLVDGPSAVTPKSLASGTPAPDHSSAKCGQTRYWIQRGWYAPGGTDGRIHGLRSGGAVGWAQGDEARLGSVPTADRQRLRVPVRSGAAPVGDSADPSTP